MQTAKRYFEGCELDDPFALRWAHLPELPAVSTRHWFRHKQRIKWRTTPKEFRIHARLGDARLEYLVPLVLRNNYGSEGLPPVRRFPNTLVALEILSLYVQIAVKYLQSNKVLGAIAFAYDFRDDRVARPPKSRLTITPTCSKRSLRQYLMTMPLPALNGSRRYGPPGVSPTSSPALKITGAATVSATPPLVDYPY